ncbi:uncharacterized protein LTHEOB_7664 [Lasiodiplodia theobromae]|uniref:uncharacterized protein n=1 Tax=Lasiodiplodia theobromae TaxID=45133 RepID=UPI0015C2D8E2|nr:uncharacterized protein LTHEOB_7664 [Lasiodiplodia theobromae]KAF4542472.1 hypothetical protein LTHEOB_7664 [Lasiodiplodia theobromae]
MDLSEIVGGGSGDGGSSRSSLDESFSSSVTEDGGSSSNEITAPRPPPSATGYDAAGSEEYVRALENRLDRIETLVRASGILDGRQAAPDAGGHVDYDVDIEALLAEVGQSGESSLPSRESTKNSDFWKHCIWQTKRSGWVNDIIEDVVARGLGPAVHTGARRFSQYARLPPMEDVLSLVGDFFAGCNNILPLYHEETFMKQLYENMAGASESAGWWASISTVLALGHISRMRSTFFPQEQERQAWAYMKNAMAIQSDFPTLDFDLLSVQALIGMALFFLITSCNSHMASMMLSTAIRVAQGNGLHINPDDPKLSETEKEQRRRVFWIACIFDKELSLRMGRAPAQDDGDMNIDLPQNNPPDKAGYVGSFNMFRAKCVFAQIQGKVYKKLYSAQAWNQPRDEVLVSVASLDRELEAWRQNMPMELRPGYRGENDNHPIIPSLPAPYDSNVLVTHFCYWYCFSLIHRRYAISISIIGDWPEAAVPRSISPTMPGSQVTDSARNMVKLLQCHPPTAKGTRWYLLYYCAAALVNLFGQIINEPDAAATSQADLARMRVVLSFMAVVCEEDNRDARNIFGMCRKMEQIAVDCLEKASAKVVSVGSSSTTGTDDGEDEEQRRRERKEWEDKQRREIVQIQRQLRVHGRFFSPMDA